MTPEDGQAQTSYRSGLILSEKQLLMISNILQRLIEMIPARFVLLIENSGQIVQVKGDLGQSDLAVIGSLIAADLAASQEIARLSGEYQDFQMIMREGTSTNIFISEAGKSLSFMVSFRKETPLGWARKLIQKTAEEIAAISIHTDSSTPAKDQVSKGELPDLFNDALDQIWKA